MPQPLSDKAKGKQRAVEPAAPVARTTRQLVIRFTDGIPDLELTLSKEDSVRNLKSNVRYLKPRASLQPTNAMYRFAPNDHSWSDDD